MRRPILVALLVSLLVATAGCGGGSGDGSAGATTAEPAAKPRHAPDTGVALGRFVEAAGAGDTATLWSLLSSRSRETLGPTQNDFARRFLESFRAGVGTFAGTDYDTIVAVEMPSGWGVAAIAGVRVREGKEEFATYAAAMRFEGGAWTLEIGDDVVLRKISPPGDSTPERRPPVTVRIQAPTQVQEVGLWLDGEPLAARASGTDGRDVTIEGVPAGELADGRHTIVIFGRAGGIASGGSAPFTVTSADA